MCVLLQIIDHLSDIKEDLSLLGRVYIPSDIMQKYNVRKSDLGLSYSKPEVREMLLDIVARLEKMQKDAKVLPQLIKSFSLRFEVSIILSLTNSVLKRYKRVDILQKSPKPTIFNWIKALFVGFFGAIFCKRIR